MLLFTGMMVFVVPLLAVYTGFGRDHETEPVTLPHRPVRAVLLVKR